MSEYKHVEAFCLMWYATKDGRERERIWNSRDGVTPFIISSPTTATAMEHTNWRQDVRALNHVPKVGDRIFVDLTDARARVFADRRLDRMLEDPKCRASLEAEFATRAEAAAALTKSMLEEHGGGSPDILVVTAGYIEELLEARKRGADPEVAMAMDHAVGESWSALAVVLPGRAEPHYRCKPHGRAYCTECAAQPPAKPPPPPTFDIESVEIRIGGVRVETSGAVREHPGSCYNRKGESIDMFEGERLLSNENYRTVALTVVSETVHVSTIWICIDHGWFQKAHEPPIIFETVVVRNGEPDTQRRYATESEALAGHLDAVQAELEKGPGN